LASQQGAGAESKGGTLKAKAVRYGVLYMHRSHVLYAFRPLHKHSSTALDELERCGFTESDARGAIIGVIAHTHVFEFSQLYFASSLSMQAVPAPTWILA
jgi:hypothetical protein